MKLVLFLLLLSLNSFAYNPMGGYFYSAKTNKKVVLTCENGEVASACEEAFFTLIDGTQVTQLHNYLSIPMMNTTDAHYDRYGHFYTLREILIEARAIGPMPWIIWNSTQITNAFKKAVKIMFTKDEMDFNTGIKLSEKNFEEMIKIIQERM